MMDDKIILTKLNEFLLWFLIGFVLTSVIVGAVLYK